MTTHKTVTGLAVLAAGFAFVLSPAFAETVIGQGNVVSGEKFGLAIGQSAAGVRDTLWTEGYGYLGTSPCAAAAFVPCAAGDTVMVFQPVELGRRGKLVLKIENGRIAAIGWDITPVAVLEG